MLYVKRLSALFATTRSMALLRPKVLLPVAALALLTALLLPLLGPLADHHFAERQPGHLHIYLAGVPIQHLHDHEALHTHDASIADPLGVEESRPVLENSVIFMPQEGEGLSVSTLGITLPS